jgi:mxaL protein
VRNDLAFIGLACALALALLACLPLQGRGSRPVFTYIAIVDITRSMNVEDYRLEGHPATRLAFFKAALRQVLADLPCGSRLGLGVFTERRASLLFEPIEVCSGFDPIATAIEQLDWRMAWAADSRVAAGLHDALEHVAGNSQHLLFFTDGQEAPPINPRYRVTFDDVRGKMKGMIVGVGGLGLSPIPKFDEAGRREGVYGEGEVPQRSTFGLSEMAPEQIEGYHARNAPFGNARAVGSEHLSSLKEEYLKGLAQSAGLDYHRLESFAGLSQALTDPRWAQVLEVPTDLRWIPAALALVALAAVYLFVPVALGSAIPRSVLERLRHLYSNEEKP